MIKKILLVSSTFALFNYSSIYATETKIVVDKVKVEEVHVEDSGKILDSEEKGLTIYKKDKIVAEDEYDTENDGSFPGLYVDYGFHIPGVNKNENIKNSFIGSRFFDITLCYNLVIPDSHFAVCVGMGYSNKTLSFEEKTIGEGDSKVRQYYTLVSVKKGEKDSRVDIKDCKDSLSSKDKASYNGSYLNLHFYNFIMDFKFFVNKMYPKDSFIFSVGMKVGVLMSANTEIEYSQNSCSKTQILVDKSNLKKIAWGFQSRAAWGRFGIVYELIMSDLYNKNEGPKIGYLQKAGVSIDLF